MFRTHNNSFTSVLQTTPVLTVSETTARSSHLFYPLKHWRCSEILRTASAIPYPPMPLSTPTPFGAKAAVALNSVCSLHGRSRKLPYCACAETPSTPACHQRKSKRQTSSDLPVLLLKSWGVLETFWAHHKLNWRGWGGGGGGGYIR